MLENESEKNIDPAKQPGQSWEIVMDAFEQAYNIAKGLEENTLAEELMCNIGIARGNLALNTQDQNYFQNYMINVTRQLQVSYGLFAHQFYCP